MPVRLRPVLLGIALTAAAVVAASTPARALVPPRPTVLLVGEIARQNVAPKPGSEPDTLVEPDIGVSPLDPGVAVGVAHDGRYPDGGAVAIAYTWTHDGGRHWRHGPVPGLTTAAGGSYGRASDPVVAFGPDGTAYLSTLLFDMPGCRSAVAVSRSTDRGATFAAPVLAHVSSTCAYSDDKNWLVVDNGAKSPHRGRLYQFWTPVLSDAAGNFVGAPQVVRWSDDKGKTWSATVRVSAASNTQNSQPMIQPDGTLTDTYLVYPPGAEREAPEHGVGATAKTVPPAKTVPQAAAAPGVRLAARTSRDGGRTWSAEVTVTTDVEVDRPDIRCCLPSATADPRTGLLYATWNSATPSEVRISSSADGVHWSRPVLVNTTAESSVVTVNADVSAYDGRVFVSYGTRDTTASAGRYVQQRLSSSYDRGAHFGAPIALGPPSDLRYAAVARGIFPGDYIGTAATKGRVYAVWCRSSTPPVASATYHQTLYGAVLRP